MPLADKHHFPFLPVLPAGVLEQSCFDFLRRSTNPPYVTAYFLATLRSRNLKNCSVAGSSGCPRSLFSWLWLLSRLPYAAAPRAGAPEPLLIRIASPPLVIARSAATEQSPSDCRNVGQERVRNSGQRKPGSNRGIKNKLRFDPLFRASRCRCEERSDGAISARLSWRSPGGGPQQRSEKTGVEPRYEK